MTSNARFTQTPDSIVATVDGTQPLPDLTAAVNAACEQAESNTGRAVVVLRLQGTSAQGREWPGPVTIQEVNRWERALRRLERLPAVSVAVAEGICGGPALDALLAVDFRIAAPDLHLMLPINDGHFWPGMSLYRLVQHLGVARARQIVIWGVNISLQQACDFGIIDQVSEDLAEATQFATVLNGRISDRELVVRRQLLLEATSADYDEALGIHLAACDRELRRLRRHDPDADRKAPVS